MIYILAQGKGSRWEQNDRNPITLPAEYKQLIPVNGEPNLFRTIRLLKELGRDDYMVIAEGTMFTDEQVNSLPNKILTLHYPGNIMNGIWQILRKNPNHDTIFLLGDVIFSQKLLKRIIFYDVPDHALWGRSGKNIFTGKAAKEIFALTVCRSNVPLVQQQLEFGKEHGTKLWNWYDGWIYSGLWEEISDWTDDIDSPEEYEQFFRQLELLAEYENV